MKIFRSSAEIAALPSARQSSPSAISMACTPAIARSCAAWSRLARERGYTPAVLTFDPHPARVLAPDRAPKLLMTIDQRLRAMEAEGIEAVLLLPFSLDFAKLTPEEFAEQILAKALRARVVLVGDDFRFGYKQSGNVDTLRDVRSNSRLRTRSHRRNRAAGQANQQ